MDQTKLTQAEDFYKDRIQGWMLSDLEKSAEAGTNFLTALGCFVYTEIIGAFLPALKIEKGKPEQKYFYRCLLRLGSSEFLLQLDETIEDISGKKIYQHFRNRMCHKYYPSISKNTNGQVLFIPAVIARDGIWVDRIKKQKFQTSPLFIDGENRVIIATKNYIEELHQAVKVFYQLTFQDHDEEYMKAAINGVKYILET